ncbi:hypothetical protein PAXRUDRAFT_20702 [Paxillus rubicundulus Ve08.2h10]|uniref:Uncharacterized protein n=1 Tax=Paxillus rubicundulus Ve08.2h10 TaxID=930991 RepID=A0A0D0CDE0_9AGAM|nr:hypothetical protein PAXRUDRAFT_20702 [Paxillus rubicundulus Ve08.2h10]
MGPNEYELGEALEDWREEKTREIHGESHLMDIGPALVMPDGMLNWIVACAHYFKIKTVNDLKRETRWGKANQYGTEVITMIHRVVPIPIPITAPAAFTRTPLQPRPIPQANSSLDPLSTPSHQPLVAGDGVNLPAKKKKCGACGLEGHNRRNRIVCTKHPDRVVSRSSINKENAT